MEQTTAVMAGQEDSARSHDAAGLSLQTFTHWLDEIEQQPAWRRRSRVRLLRRQSVGLRRDAQGAGRTGVATGHRAADRPDHRRCSRHGSQEPHRLARHCRWRQGRRRRGRGAELPAQSSRTAQSGPTRRAGKPTPVKSKLDSDGSKSGANKIRSCIRIRSGPCIAMKYGLTGCPSRI